MLRGEGRVGGVDENDKSAFCLCADLIFFSSMMVVCVGLAQLMDSSLLL